MFFATLQVQQDCGLGVGCCRQKTHNGSTSCASPKYSKFLRSMIWYDQASLKSVEGFDAITEATMKYVITWLQANTY